MPSGEGLPLDDSVSVADQADIGGGAVGGGACAAHQAKEDGHINLYQGNTFTSMPITLDIVPLLSLPEGGVQREQ